MNEYRPTKIIRHHTADSSEAAQFWKVEKWHEREGYPKSALNYFCFYNYFIERNGTIVHPRPDDDPKIGTKAHGRNSIDICLAGNFDFQSPTKLQLEAYGRLVHELAEKYEIPPERINGHKVYSSTSCPGTNFTDSVATYELIKFKIGLLQKILWKLLTQLGL